MRGSGGNGLEALCEVRFEEYGNEEDAPTATYWRWAIPAD
jgi:hypothetical protein